MRFGPLLILPLLVGACASAPATDTALAHMRTAVGAGGWPGNVARIRFTWHHLGKDILRSYDWNLETGVVRATIGGVNSTFPAKGPAEQHPAFVNDSYWFLFEYMIGMDGSRKSDLGTVPVPGFDALGARPAIDVRYERSEGYTGGDRYVLYLGEGDVPVAWAFHKGGADEPTVVTTRGKRIEAAGLSFPTEFALADGTVVIRVEDVVVTPRSPSLDG